MEKIYRFYNDTKTTSSILELIDIDIATGKVKGRDIYTGRRVTVKRSNVLDRAYLTEYEADRRLKKGINQKSALLKGEQKNDRS